jgi:hypothetical protein
LRKNSSVVVASDNSHTIFEWLEVELLQKGSFGIFNFLSGSADLKVLGNLNLTLDDLG